MVMMMMMVMMIVDRGYLVCPVPGARSPCTVRAYGQGLYRPKGLTRSVRLRPPFWQKEVWEGPQNT
eukprot:9899668-Karenia_brevis.AAC.1